VSAYVFDFTPIARYWPLLAEGAWLTVQLSTLAMIGGAAVGLAMALARNSALAPLRWAAGIYVEFIRNTPFLVQLFLLFFGLPSLGLALTPETAALAGLIINLGAYATEIFRAGIEAVQRGQVEAGIALGLSRGQVFRHVVLGQALQIVWPALTSQLVLLMLASSIVSQISADELTGAAYFVQNESFRAFEVYLFVTAAYLALALAYRAAFWLIALALFPRRRAALLAARR
jgi:polar amino acid transport system permease protein